VILLSTSSGLSSLVSSSRLATQYKLFAINLLASLVPVSFIYWADRIISAYTSGMVFMSMCNLLFRVLHTVYHTFNLMSSQMCGLVTAKNRGLIFSLSCMTWTRTVRVLSLQGTGLMRRASWST